MHSTLKLSITWAAFGAALLLPSAHAQLLLTGKVTGMFTDPNGPHTTVSNASDGSWATFKSGVPEHSWDKQTEIDFAEKDFTNIGPGLVATNLFDVTNGRNFLHTTATSAHFNLWLTLTAPSSHSGLLTAIPFTIVNTPNGPDPHSVDDSYSISASPIAPFKLDNTWVQFTFVAPPSFTIEEDASKFVGDLYVNFTPVPEPATYSAIGAALLVGLIGFRTLRRRNGVSTLPAATA